MSLGDLGLAAGIWVCASLGLPVLLALTRRLGRLVGPGRRAGP